MANEKPDASRIAPMRMLQQGMVNADDETDEKILRDSVDKRINDGSLANDIRENFRRMR